MGKIMTRKFSVIVLLALICMMTGIAAAPPVEEISAIFDGSQIKSEVSCLSDFWYQIRYYPPGNFDPVAFEDGSDFNSGLYFTGPTINGSLYTNGIYVEYFTPNCKGNWTVALVHDGTTDNDHSADEEGINSPKDYCYVIVTTFIPEFPTIAVPVIVVLGMMFIFQRRKEGN